MYTKVFDKQSISTFQQWIAKASHIVILSHTNADGDACGSLLGLTIQLDSAAKESKSVTPILPNGCPKTFEWLPGSERILSGETQLHVCQERIDEADLIVCVDLNSASRTDFLQTSLLEAKGKKVLIDHHHDPAEDQFDIIFSDSDISSACELVVWLSTTLWGEQYFNADVARCLYTGLHTDTGGFAFSCHQPSCFEAAARLVSYDINPADIHNRIVNTFSFNRMRFYGFAISQKLQIYPNHKIAIFTFSLEEQQRFHVGGEDMEGLVNYTLMMSEVTVGLLLREEVGRTKVSFRSKYDVDVNILAKQLGGGGHIKAAGATYPQPIDITLQAVRTLLNLEDEQPLSNFQIQ